MSLAPGTKLGGYDLLAPIGRGGMGEVYRARDRKLGRDVAIKVLPGEFSRDAERLSRFEREARLLAQLSHKNVATLHGLEEEDGRTFLVMELVEGEDLAERIARGPIPFDEARPLFVQIAEGLEAAHQKRIVHRDLKPANVKMTPDGVVKILDFGLAKAFATEVAADDEDASRSPTLTRGTALGVILGTASYMSPEQARGTPVDERTDIWAFGCCLYEALTGKKAFEGDTVSDTLSLILQREPDWSRARDPLSPRVVQLLRRCLDKNRRQRLQAIGEARIVLSDVPAESEPELTIESVRWKRVSATVAVLAAGVLIGWLLRAGADPPISPATNPTTRSTIDLPEEAPLDFRTEQVPVALSPDGSLLVYGGRSRDGTQLYRRAMDDYNVSAIPGTEGGFSPFFSPDGEWVGFFANDQLKKVSLRGGAPVTLADVRLATRASWTADDTIYVAENEGFRLTRIPAGGGTPREVVDVVDLTGRLSRVSQVLPDGRSVLVTSRARSMSDDYSDILLVSLDSLETKLVAERGYDARYLSSGHVVFARSGNLLAVPFDLDRKVAAGEPATVVTDVAMNSLFTDAYYAFSENGALVYAPGGDVSAGKLAWVDRDGETEYLPVPERVYGSMDLAPDGERLAVQVADLNDYIWIYDIARREGRRLITEGNAASPLWAPDGRAIAFSDGGSGGVFVQEVEGRSPPEVLTTSPGMAPTSWTPDGRVLARNRTPNDVDFVARGNAKAPGWEIAGLFGTFSPDGRWIAYSSEDGLWIRSFPDGETGRQISGGGEPVWCQACNELFTRAGNEWMASVVSLSPELSWDPPRVVFESDHIGVPGINYDVTADGQRLLIVKRAREPERSKLHVVQHWVEELERLVPSRN